jgi:nucleoid-associated protein YgaU
MFKSSIAFLAACLIAAPAFSQAPAGGNVIEIQANAPDRYVVQKGDTLWGIAGKFLKNPWEWPQVWRMNRDQIKNPHWIYPGNVVRLDRSTGTLSLEQVSLSPQVRTEPLAGEAIPAIPAKIIEPFLTQPLVTERGGLNNAPRIVATPMGRVNVGTGSRIYADGLKESNTPLWYIYRQGIPLIDPETQETLGFEAVFLGQAQMIKAGDPATLQIISAKREVGEGDRLVAASPNRVFNYVPSMPERQIQGRVMSIYDGRSDAYQRTVGSREIRTGELPWTGVDPLYQRYDETGPLGIVTINRGSRDGLQQGNVLALYTSDYVVNDRSVGPFLMGDRRPPNVQLPEERYGLVMVFRVFENVSYALVMQAQRQVSPKDVVRNP